MGTIYVVTSGYYSGYRIEAIFSTKERAEEYIAVYNRADIGSDGNPAPARWYDDRRIEEYELDEGSPPPHLIEYAEALQTHTEAVANVLALEITDPTLSEVPGKDLYSYQYTAPLQARHHTILADTFVQHPRPPEKRTGFTIDAPSLAHGAPFRLTFTGPDHETIHRYARDLFARHRAERDTTGTSWLMGEITRAFEYQKEANAPQ